MHISLRFYLLLGLFIVLLYTCANSNAVPPTPTPVPSTPTAAPPTPTPTATPKPTVSTASITVKGQKMTVLTDASGKTLYYFKKDTATKAACTGNCTDLWPPLLLATGTPTSSGSLPGKLTVVTDANGKQIQYNGHFLYTFKGDFAAGQANGQGIGGVWFVATPTLPAQA
jgi:predicted lipoprotein with Yx(FWY)xxD motif